MRVKIQNGSLFVVHKEKVKQDTTHGTLTTEDFYILLFGKKYQPGGWFFNAKRVVGFLKLIFLRV